GEKAHQHAFARGRQRHPTQSSAQTQSGTRAGIHWFGRIRRSHAEEPASPQKDSRRNPAQTRRPAARGEGGGRVNEVEESRSLRIRKGEVWSGARLSEPQHHWTRSLASPFQRARPGEAAAGHRPAVREFA